MEDDGGIKVTVATDVVFIPTQDGERAYSDSDEAHPDRPSEKGEHYGAADDDDADGDFARSQASSQVRDQQDMARMGRKQEVKRVFRTYSLWSFTSIVLSTWEYIVLGSAQGLTYGGRGGIFWSWLVDFGLSIVLTASLAEMASMAPTAAGQYHWVSEFAPRRYQKFLSYLTGWLSVLFWQAGLATSNIAAGATLESLITLYNPDYELLAWRSTLMTIPPLAVLLIWGLFFHSYLPMLQNLTMIVHVMGGLLITYTMWVCAPHVSARDALLTFPNAGAYSSKFVMIMIGQFTPLFALASSDAPVHMSEEVYDAAHAVPKAMMNGLYLSGALGTAVCLAFVFSIPSVEDALNYGGGPFYYVMELAWPTTGYTYTVWLMTLLVVFGNIPYAAAASRITFALARDGGMPFSNKLSTIHKKLQVPVYAIVFTIGCTLVVSFIKLGNETVYNAVSEICEIGQMGSYFVAIVCILYRRIRDPDSLPRARWSLGRLGVPMNVVAAIFAANTVFWTVWPTELPVEWSNFNFSAPVSGLCIGICTLFYFVYGRKTYVSPLERIMG